jgi:hypothetical protein
MNNKIKLIYISDIGRSGSTLLDLLISTSNNVFSVGGMYGFNEMKNENACCSCGKKFNECSFWSNFKTKKYNVINRYNFNDYFSTMLFLCNPFSKQQKFRVKSDNFELFSDIKKMNSGEMYILDSSKDLVRLIELSQDERFDIYNISVFRDGRAVANSFNSKTQSQGKNYYLSLLKWIFVNIVLIKFQKKSDIKTLNISYNKLCKNPPHQFKKIEKFTGIQIPSNYIEIAKTMDYHNIGGNRLRLKENRANLEAIKIDNKWQYRQNRATKSVATILTFLFNKRQVFGK